MLKNSFLNLKLYSVLICFVLRTESLEESLMSSFEIRLLDIIKKHSSNSSEVFDCDNDEAFLKLMNDYTLVDRLKFLKTRLKTLLAALKDNKKQLKPGAISMLKGVLNEMQPQFSAGNFDDISLKEAFNFSDVQIEQFHDRYADVKVLLFKLEAAVKKRIKL